MTNNLAFSNYQPIATLYFSDFAFVIVQTLIRVQSVSAIAWVFDSCKSITISGASLQAIWTVYTHVHGHHVHQNDQCAAGSHLTYTVRDT